MDPDKDPQKDPGGTGENAPGAGPAKPPPWQVPKPELHPELLNPVEQDKRPQDKGQPQDFPQPSPIIDPFARERERELASAAARKKRSQRRTVVVGLGVTALLAGTITAIVASNEQEADYAQVCFNDETGERVEDTQCNSTAGRGGGLYAWYFYARGASVPAVGQNRSAYPSFTKTVPQGAKTSTGYSTKGGTVSRGGFGSSSKGGGSTGG
ncbi:Tat pathway signal protein [Arthrobacter sp. ISL-5]|uniref:Tat pathway signal protein n=1 Tax=Arthrobacter sp. ISL-5 TaxID=2819111 RepID=UPI001BEA9D35|nr:Tat pathway signal protein [Arthrobacter sp. ISL-5]MBT2552471.1 Tat pathway signal protein [Arthrobacter sp. ISL-5]